jgi:hypothetical protein
MSVSFASHKALLACAIEELDHAVMLELHAFGKDANRRLLIEGKT